MLASAIADYLARLGQGVVADDLFVDYLPAAPDTCTAVFHAGGMAGQGSQAEDSPTIQIRTRSNAPAVAYARCAAAYAALSGLRNVTLGGTYLYLVRGLQSAPQAIGRDAAGRAEYTLTLVVTIRNPTRHRV